MCMFSEVWQQSRYNTLTIPLLLAILGRTSSRHTDINQAACAYTHTHARNSFKIVRNNQYILGSLGKCIGLLCLLLSHSLND